MKTKYKWSISYFLSYIIIVTPYAILFRDNTLYIVSYIIGIIGIVSICFRIGDKF